jgi:hypothetical protein
MGMVFCMILVGAKLYITLLDIDSGVSGNASRDVRK